MWPYEAERQIPLALKMIYNGTFEPFLQPFTLLWCQRFVRAQVIENYHFTLRRSR